MIAPRLEIDLEKIQFNARTLVNRLAVNISPVATFVIAKPPTVFVLINNGVYTRTLRVI